MNIKKLIILMLTIALLAGLTACEASDLHFYPTPQPILTPEPAATAAPTQEPTATPTPEPTPEVVSNLPAGDAVTVDGTLLASGSVVRDGITCVSLREAVEALGKELSLDGMTAGFEWRGAEVSLSADDTAVCYGEKQAELAMTPFSYGEELMVPLQSFCDALEIGYFEDAEYSHLYCTPGAGSWELKEGVTVPVLMYHSTSAYWNGDDALVVRPPQFRLQMEMFVEEGYQFIWFEDLAEIDKYDKPIILTFDDGYKDNYTELLPVLQEFNAKATFFIVTLYMRGNGGSCMNEADLQACLDSGLISIQSHTVNHNYLSGKTVERLNYELEESKLILMRFTGKEPFVLSYPCGETSALVYERTPEYYRFAVKMNGKIWVTGEDPIQIYHVPVFKGRTVDYVRQQLADAYIAG